MKKFNLYKIFIVKSGGGSDYQDRTYELYAISDSKKIVKKFKEQRNMNKFIVSKTLCDDDESIAEAKQFLEKHYQNKLSVKKLMTKVGWYKFSVDIALTKTEEDVIDDQDMIYEGLWGGLNDRRFFNCLNNEYAQALLNLGFSCTTNSDAADVADESDELYDNYNPMGDEDQQWFITPDELNIFIQIYQNTLR